MKRIDTSTASENENGEGKDGFTDGDPNAVPPVPATVVDQDWFNNVQEEICNAITEQGITLSGSDNGQLSDAIRNPASLTTGQVACAQISATRANEGTAVGNAPKMTFNASAGTSVTPSAVLANTDIAELSATAFASGGTRVSVYSHKLVSSADIASSERTCVVRETFYEGSTARTIIRDATGHTIPSTANYKYATSKTVTSSVSLIGATTFGLGAMTVDLGVSTPGVVLTGPVAVYVPIVTAEGQQASTLNYVRTYANRTAGTGTITLALYLYADFSLSFPSFDLANVAQNVSTSAAVNNALTSPVDITSKTAVLVIAAPSGTAGRFAPSVHYSYTYDRLSPSQK